MVSKAVLPLVLFLLLLGLPGHSRLVAQAPRAEFRSGVKLVALSVVVTDPQQKFVPGLGIEDFTVLDNGVPQHLSFFASTRVPIDLALLLDTSSSMSNLVEHEPQDVDAAGGGGRVCVDRAP